MARSSAQTLVRRSWVVAVLLITLPLAAALLQVARRGPGPLVSAVSVAPLMILALMSHLFCDLVGYRMAPVDPTLPPDQAESEALATYLKATVVRYAITMPVPALGLAASVATEPPSAQIFLLSVLMATAVRILHVLPTCRAVGRSEAALRAGGARVDLAALRHWTRVDST